MFFICGKETHNAIKGRKLIVGGKEIYMGKLIIIYFIIYKTVKDYKYNL